MSNSLKILIKIIISTTIILGLSLLVCYLVYDFQFSLISISDSLFVVNIVICVMSLAINLGAMNILTPFSYTIKLFFIRKKIKEKYASYKDYYEDKKNTGNSIWYLTIETSIMLVIAFIFAMLATK